MQASLKNDSIKEKKVQLSYVQAQITLRCFLAQPLQVLMLFTASKHAVTCLDMKFTCKIAQKGTEFFALAGFLMIQPFQAPFSSKNAYKQLLKLHSI